MGLDMTNINTVSRTGRTIYEEIFTLRTEIRELEEACSSVEDSVGRDSTAFKILKNSLSEANNKQITLLNTRYYTKE